MHDSIIASHALNYHCLPHFTVAWVVGEDLVILEVTTTLTMAFSITRGDRSERTRAFAYTEGGSATAGELCNICMEMNCLVR